MPITKKDLLKKMDKNFPKYQQILILLLLIKTYAAFRQEGSCLFPERWEGTWFQSGVRFAIAIEGPILSNKGTCLASEGDKFLVVDDKRICYRCVVIHEKHANVLQYKETYCHERDTLQSLCRMITGDALLYSMFREGALPVPCPFRGPFTFTYNRGHGECRSPVSSIDACTEDSRLLLSYQACPDVYGTESTVEELECLATWKEGSSRYLVGKVHHSHATSNEDRFRCFVYEKTTNVGQQANIQQFGDDIDYKVAQSGDATCNGLSSATEGSRTMTLRKAPSLNKCRFPSFLSAAQHWHTLDYSITYSFHHKNSTLRVTNSTAVGNPTETKIVCTQIKLSGSTARDDSPVMLLAHYTMGCQNGYVCIMFHRRSHHVIEVQSGTHVRRAEDACNSSYFNRTTAPFITLVTPSPEAKQCPYIGKFAVTNIKHENDYNSRILRKRDWQRWRHNFNSGEITHLSRRQKRIDHNLSPCLNNKLRTLAIGCSTIDTFEFYSECPNSDIILSYSCHGGWEENGTHFLITTPLSRSSHGARRYCFIYREEKQDSVIVTGANPETKSASLAVYFSSSSHSCDRNIKPGIEGSLAFNITRTGKCIETNNNTRNKFSLPVLLLAVLPKICYIMSLDLR